MMKIAIIGAGLTGLVAGYRLNQKGQQVTIFEKSGDIGGLMGGFKIGDTSLEKAYHHIFSTDNYIISLAKELGLRDKISWHEEKTALYFDKQIYPFMGAIDLLRFKPLDLISKIRLGLVKIWLQLDNDWQKYENVTAAEWMEKWCGQRAYKIIWEPLLRGKFHDKYKQVSMAWLWARIHTRGNSDKLGYFKGGFRIIADGLAKKIKESGGTIKVNSEVDFKKIEKEFDKILYTGPSKEVEYLGAINVVFTSKQSLSPYYWHNINDAKSPFLAFIQHTNLINEKEYGGKHVYYMGTYVPNDGELMNKTDTQIKKLFFDFLKKIFPKFRTAEKSWVFKMKNAQHLVKTNYELKNTNYELKKNKIYQANFAQIYPEDRGTNFAVREGEKVAALILEDLQ